MQKLIHYQYSIPREFVFIASKIDDVDTDYFINKIENNISHLSYKTNVKGQMTDWKTFLGDEKFHMILKNFFEIEKPNFVRGVKVCDAWGIKMQKGDSTKKHSHSPFSFSACLYLNDVESEVIYPEINLKFKIEKNTLLFWSAWLDHFTALIKNGIKYAVVSNLEETKEWSENE
jgi:hypothetical protein